MDKTTIYFIRHGEIDNPLNVLYGRSLDLQLNEKGKEQLKNLAEEIKKSGVTVDAIYTSPLSRAVDSAYIIGRVFNNPPIAIEEDLIEVDIPALVGHPNSEIDEIHAKGIDEYSKEFVKKGNESRDQIVERMMKATKKIREKNLGKTIFAISHGDPLRFLLFGLTHQNSKTPSMNELKRFDYPKRGEGYKIIFDSMGNILHIEFIKNENRN